MGDNNTNKQADILGYCCYQIDKWRDGTFSVVWYDRVRTTTTLLRDQKSREDCVKWLLKNQGTDKYYYSDYAQNVQENCRGK